MTRVRLLGSNEGGGAGEKVDMRRRMWGMTNLGGWIEEEQELLELGGRCWMGERGGAFCSAVSVRTTENPGHHLGMGYFTYSAQFHNRACGMLSVRHGHPAARNGPGPECPHEGDTWGDIGRRCFRLPLSLGYWSVLTCLFRRNHWQPIPSLRYTEPDSDRAGKSLPGIHQIYP